MEKKTIRLTEAELRSLIREAVEDAIQEADELEEGWFGDKWNQAKAAGNTFTQKGDMSLSKTDLKKLDKTGLHKVN